MAKNINILVLIIVLALVFFNLPLGTSTPLEIFDSLVKFMTSGDFLDDLLSSLILTIKAMFFSIIIAMLISYCYVMPIIKWKGQEIHILRAVVEFITKCRYLTLTGIIFIFIMLSKDLGNLKIMLLMFGIIPFFVTSMVGVIKSINPQYYDVCKTLKFNDWQTLWELIIVGKIDSAIEVVRQNFAISWLMITMVEGLDMSGGGIGTVLIKSNRVFHLADVFAVQIVVLMLGIVFDYTLAQLRVFLFPYVKLETK